MTDRIRALLGEQAAKAPRWCARAASAACLYGAFVAWVAAMKTSNSGLATAFLVSGIGLLWAGISMALGRDGQRVLIVLRALVGAAFVLAVTDIGTSDVLAAARYHPLWVPSALAVIWALAELGNPRPGRRFRRAHRRP